MADNILTAAAALGGTIRSFEQHSSTEQVRGNCMVHSARWLRAKQKQGDFIKKYGTHSIMHGNLKAYRDFTVPEAHITLDRGYEEAYPGMPPYNGKIYVKLERRGPGEDVEVKASKIRSNIKPFTSTSYEANLVRFVEEGGRGLRGEADSKILFRKGESKNIVFDSGWEAKLLKRFLKPGYYFAGMYGGGMDHAIAFLVTEAEFWYFDPAVGELKLERDVVEQWLTHDDVKKYFATGRSFIAVTNYISQV